jgi:hypothetical protein
MKTKTLGNPPAEVLPGEMRESIRECAILIVAAGFEARAHRVLDMLGAHLPRRIVLVKYPPGIKENDQSFRRMFNSLSGKYTSTEVVPVVLDPRHPDEYFQNLKSILLKWRPDAVGNVWIDISAFPMQGICSTLAAVRAVLSGLVVRVLYTEAARYFPTKSDVAHGDSRPHSAMSQEMSGNLIPKQFGGSSSEVSTCLIVFAGYEKHRSVGVVDELNPSKLVLVFGHPARPELQWRLHWSQKLHEALKSMRPTASETVSTLNPLEALSLLNQYYGFLFADHNVTVSPICSKMQCVACYLFWERYRDVQLVFPLPVSYLPKRFSKGYRGTFQFTLPTTSEMSVLAPSPL